MIIPEEAKAKVIEIIKNIHTASSSKDFFDSTCLLSSYFEDLDEEKAYTIIAEVNLYVEIISAVFNNECVYQALAKLCISSNHARFPDQQKDEEDIESKVLLNSALSCAFFIPALSIKKLSEVNIRYIRELVSKSVKLYQKRLEFKADFLSICDVLEMSSWNLKYHHNQHYRAKYPIKLKDQVLFVNLKRARSMAGISLLSLMINPLLSARLKKVYATLGKARLNITVALSEVHHAVYKVDAGILNYISQLESPGDQKYMSKYSDFSVKNNEKNSIFFLKGVTSNCHYQEEKRFYEVILEKVHAAPSLRDEYMVFAQKHLKAFYSNVDPDDIEWSNKLFAISFKTLSILCALNQATDSKWVVKSAIFELKDWIINIHEVLNKYFIEDDWAYLSGYLRKEDSRVEWKSSFFTPLEQEFISPEAESGIGQRLFKKIVQTIVGMINTDGGTIIVGHIENPHLVLRTDLKDHILTKEGSSFFDIEYELSNQKKTIDMLRLQIVQDLVNITDNSAEKFNDLISIEPLSISNGETRITIVKIGIGKAQKILTNVRKENDVVWVSLTKRANGQTISVDIRDYM